MGVNKFFSITFSQEETLSIKRVLDSLNLDSIRRFLTSFYHGAGAGRKPYDPVFMLKAQILKHLLRARAL